MSEHQWAQIGLGVVFVLASLGVALIGYAIGRVIDR